MYFCDGNHEDHDKLDDLAVPWDHKTRRLAMSKCNLVEVAHNIRHVRRGCTISLPDGRIVLFAGGAESFDRGDRMVYYSWFPQEIPNYMECGRALSHKKVNIVIIFSI